MYPTTHITNQQTNKQTNKQTKQNEVKQNKVNWTNETDESNK